MKKELNTENKINDIKIIDLDKLDNETSIDYNKLSSEDSMLMEFKDSSTSINPRSKTGFVDRILHINWHIILLAVMAFSVIFIIYRFKNWGTQVDLDNLAPIDDSNYDVEVVDNILPLLYEGDAPAMNDGETNIVLFGNDTFAQNRGTADDMANLIAELTGATVYNCAVTGSYLASDSYSIDPNNSPMSAFSLYWLTTAFAIGNTAPYEPVFSESGDKLSADAQIAFDTMLSIDFNKVDVIGIMYDAHDYLAGKPLTNLENPTDIMYYTGNLEASIELIKEVYPHIRIIVMSPTYAYALNPDGDYVSSDIYCYLEDYKLSTYALMVERSTSMQGVSFVDNIYGTVNENNADQYLLDHINLNVAGRQKLAERFVYALEYYDEK